VLMGVGVGLFLTNDGEMHRPGRNDVMAVVEAPASPEPGSAVSDLQSLEKNHDLYSDFDLLDDLQVQHDVVANP
jgi:propanediol dehydratase large subunit